MSTRSETFVSGFCSILLVFAGLVSLGIGFVHLSTFFKPSLVQLPYLIPAVFAPGFLCIGGYLYLMYLRQAKPDYSLLLWKHAWPPMLLMVVTMGYVAYNFFGSAGQGGTEAQKAIMDLRAFSGHGLGFALGVFFLTWADSMVHAAQLKLQPTETYPDLFQEDSITLPAGQYVKYADRLNATGWRSLKWAIGIQAVVISTFALVAQVYFYLFVSAFISLNLLNFFWFRKQVRFSLLGLERKGGAVVASYYDFDERKDLEVPLHELKVFLEEIPTRSVTKVYKLVFQQGGEAWMEFRCDIGFWSLERSQQIVNTVEGWKS